MIPQKIISKIIIVAIVFVSGAFAGYSYRSSLNYKGVIKQQDKDSKFVMKHEVKKDAADIKVNEGLEKANAIEDKSGCLDNPSNDDYLNELFNADSAAQREFD